MNISRFASSNNGKIQPTTSEELMAYNFLRTLGKLDLYSSIPRMDCRFKDSVMYEGNVCLHGVFSYKSFNPFSALGVFLVLRDCDPVAYTLSLYRAYVFGERRYDRYESFLKLIDDMKRYASESEYFDEVPDFRLPYDYPDSGEYDLSWDYITPKEEYFELVHPNHVDDDEFLPYFLANPYSKCSFTPQQIEQLSQICTVHIHCINGVIDDAEVIVNQAMVETLLPGDTYVEVNLDDPIRKCLKGFERNVYMHDTVHKIAAKNSIFLNYLVKCHLFKYSIKFCIECVSTYSNVTCSYEDANVFYIDENSQSVYFVYENQNPARCSYLFAADRDRVEEAVEAVVSFFASCKRNKREMMTYHANVFKDYGVTQETRIFHDSFYSWKYTIARHERYF